MELPLSVRTLADLLHVYEAEYLPHAAATTQYHYHLLFRRFCDCYGGIPLTELTAALLRTWRDELLRQYEPATVRQYLAALSGAFNAAVIDFEWLPDNPLRRVRKPPVPPGRVRMLSAEERAQLLPLCKESLNPYLYLLVVLALSTGARKMELCRLQWGDVDLSRGLLHLARTKNKHKRSVPIVGEALDLLRAHALQRWCDWLFPRQDGLRPVLIDQAWRTVVRRAGIQDLRFHDLRHTAASFLAMSGASLRDIAEILGHRNIQHTMKYAHLLTSHTTGVLERMAQQFLSCLFAAVAWRWIWWDADGPATVDQLGQALGIW